jgi:hypothetical protein
MDEFDKPLGHVQQLNLMLVATSSLPLFLLSFFSLFLSSSTTTPSTPNTNANSSRTCTHITMNWLKTKMGSHGWDITDDDIKKPNVLFLVPVKFARQELEDFEEYFTVKVTKRPVDQFFQALAFDRLMTT